MKKLFKSKERRDTLLLVVMGVIFILFLVYLFVPLGHQDPDPEDVDAVQIHSNLEDPLKLSETFHPGEGNFTELNLRIERELDEILAFLKQSPQPFRLYPVDGLNSLLFPGKEQAEANPKLNSLYKVIDKIRRIGFYDLIDIFDFDFPKQVEKNLIFNLYTGFFMLKLREGRFFEEISDFPDTVFRRIISCRPYLHIANEIEKDFQSLPALFYFYMLLQRLDVYPIADDVAFLKTRVGDIRDLSEGKIIDRICSLLDFSQDPRIYRIAWVEEDDLNPNDRRSYNNLKISTYAFLNQTYLVFPDFERNLNNKWIRDLQESDSGNIELADFQLSDEDPVKSIQVQAIYYAPGTSRFVILLDRHDFSEESGFPDRLVYKKIVEVNQFFLTVDFASRFTDSDAFQSELMNFGHFIKKQVSVQ